MLIIDTETTGLDGAPGDRVLEIGIANLDEVRFTVNPLYEALVRYPDEEEFFELKGHVWVFENTDLSPGLIESMGDPVDAVVKQVRRLVAGRTATAYNAQFDFGRFLSKAPWDLGRYCTVTMDIMEGATKVVEELARSDAIEDKPLQRRLLDEWDSHPGKWVRAIDAYKALCPDDPAGLGGAQTHRALDDAMQEAHILRAIWMDRPDTRFSWPTPSPMQGSWEALRCTRPRRRPSPAGGSSPTAWTGTRKD